MSNVLRPLARLRASALLLTELVVLTGVSPAEAAPPAAALSPKRTEQRTLVMIAGDRLTVSAADVELSEILNEIARQARIRIAGDTDFAERVSVAFADLPIEEGLRRLVVDHHRVFIYGPDAKLDEVRAYRVPPAGLRPVALLPAEPGRPLGSPGEPAVGPDGQAPGGRDAPGSPPSPRPVGQTGVAAADTHTREDPKKPEGTAPPTQQPGPGVPRTGDAPIGAVGVTASGPIANATITGPIAARVAPGDPSHNYPQLASHLDLAAAGYLEEEYFLEGTARRFRTQSLATGSIISSGHPYRTRMIVRRPQSADQFNGTVLIEWLDVTSAFDLDVMWMASHEHILRGGYAYVGVSAQKTGVHESGTGLRSWSPARYSTLDVTAGGSIQDDSLSYDIFSQAAQAIRHPEGLDPLGGLHVQHVFAVGAQQPPGHLVTYHNSIHPLALGFDAFLLLGTGGQLRTDLEVPVFAIATEADLLVQFWRQPDSDRLRTWEVAGASRIEPGRFALAPKLLSRDGLPGLTLAACARPAPSRIPVGHVVNAAYDHLVRWVQDGPPPPTAPRIELESQSPVVVARDARGNARGGIRLAQHAVPTATNTGINSGPGLCPLAGAYEAFDEKVLGELYPDHERYLSAVHEVTDKNYAAGHMTAEDADVTNEEAVHSAIGKAKR